MARQRLLPLVRWETPYLAWMQVRSLPLPSRCSLLTERAEIGALPHAVPRFLLRAYGEPWNPHVLHDYATNVVLVRIHRPRERVSDQQAQANAGIERR